VNTARRNTLILVGLLIVLTPLAVWGLGSLAIVIGLLAVIVIFGVQGVISVRREHKALMRHFRARGPLPVEAQIEEFLRSQGHVPSPEMLRVVGQRWREVAGMLTADPRLLRVTDSIEDDYHPLRAAYGDLGAIDFFHSQVSLREIADGVRPPVAVAPPLCPYCRYDLSGIPSSSLCPECGRPSLHIRTLGDYLLFIARLAPAEARVL
jgi:hypothetical protein